MTPVHFFVFEITWEPRVSGPYARSPDYSANLVQMEMPMTCRSIRKRAAVALSAVMLSQVAWTASPYEGSWFECLFDMGGRRSPYMLTSIKLTDGQLTVVEEWGVKHAFSGVAKVEGNQLVIRGCNSYQGEPMDSCDPERPPVAYKLKLPLQKKRPANIDAALKRGEAIYLSPSLSFTTLANRCEQLVEGEEERKNAGGR